MALVVVHKERSIVGIESKVLAVSTISPYEYGVSYVHRAFKGMESFDVAREKMAGNLRKIGGLTRCVGAQTCPVRQL